MAFPHGLTRSGRSYTPDPYTAFGQPLPTPAATQPSQPLAGTVPGSDVSLPGGDTLLAIKSMLESVPPTSPFEKNLVNCVNLVIAQMREIKYNVEMANTRAADMSHSLKDVRMSAIRSEQYSRRDCVTVTGLTQSEGETPKELVPKVATVLSKSGVTVKAEDISACHRNGGKVKQIKLRDGSLKSIPPTITVKFKSINQKDELIKGYKNFDAAKSKPADVQVYHSLSKHYAGLRRDILNFFRTDEAAAGRSAKWVKYLSPTSGLALKLRTDEFMKGIHSWDDFVRCFQSLVRPSG